MAAFALLLRLLLESLSGLECNVSSCNLVKRGKTRIAAMSDKQLLCSFSTRSECDNEALSKMPPLHVTIRLCDKSRYSKWDTDDGVATAAAAASAVLVSTV